MIRTFVLQVRRVDKENKETMSYILSYIFQCQSIQPWTAMNRLENGAMNRLTIWGGESSRAMNRLEIGYRSQKYVKLHLRNSVVGRGCGSRVVGRGLWVAGRGSRGVFAYIPLLGLETAMLENWHTARLAKVYP